MATLYRTLEDFDAIDCDSKVASVRLMLNSPVNESKIILIVEGPDDVEVYRRFFNPDSVELFADGSCDKHNVILSSLNPFYKKRIAAIKDADFDIVNGLAPIHENLFLTDKHDLEGMILCGGVPKDVVEKYPDRCSGISIYDIYSDLESVSYLRWMNNVNGLCLNFKKQNLAHYYYKPYSIDINNYITCLLKDSNSPSCISKEDLDAFIEAHRPQDLTLLVRGHDLMNCLFIRAKDVDNSNFEKKKFFRTIRDSYSMELFVKTQLYSSLIGYSNLLKPPLPFRS